MQQEAGDNYKRKRTRCGPQMEQQREEISTDQDPISFRGKKPTPVSYAGAKTA